jgi:hypothetical protein
MTRLPFGERAGVRGGFKLTYSKVLLQTLTLTLSLSGRGNYVNENKRIWDSF